MSTELTTPIKIEIPGIGTIESADLYLKSDADKVIEELKACIAELETLNRHLKEERRWRKFPDEKPELGDIVLVKFSERTKAHYYPIDIVRWDSTYELGEIEISHWMPRPSAPQEEMNA